MWLSGGVRVIVEYANRLTNRGHQITIVTPGGTIDPDMQQEVLPSVKIRESRINRQPNAKSLQSLQLSWSLAKAVPSSDIILSTHTPTTVVGFIAAYIFRRGNLAWLYQDYQEMFMGRPQEEWLLRHALKWHKAALVVSNYSKQELNSFSSGRVIVVSEGLSHAEIFTPRPKQDQISAHPKTVLFFGDMRPRKGLFDFLEAARLLQEKMNDFKLLIVSKESCQIESEIPFEYIYRPTRHEQVELYATCDLFVSASWWESFGLPPLEAMACGAPVVMTDSRGVRDYARHKENCLMVPPRQPQALADAMHQILTDQTLSDKLRANGPPTAEKFDWETATDRFEQALSEIV